LLDGYKTEFPPLKPWITKIFDKANIESEKDSAYENESAVKSNLSKFSGDESDFASEEQKNYSVNEVPQKLKTDESP